MTDLVLVPGLLCTRILWAHQLRFLADIATIHVADVTGADTIAGMADAVLDNSPPTFCVVWLVDGRHRRARNHAPGTAAGHEARVVGYHRPTRIAGTNRASSGAAGYGRQRPLRASTADLDPGTRAPGSGARHHLGNGDLHNDRGRRGRGVSSPDRRDNRTRRFPTTPRRLRLSDACDVRPRRRHHAAGATRRNGGGDSECRARSHRNSAAIYQRWKLRMRRLRCCVNGCCIDEPSYAELS